MTQQMVEIPSTQAPAPTSADPPPPNVKVLSTATTGPVSEERPGLASEGKTAVEAGSVDPSQASPPGGESTESSSATVDPLLDKVRAENAKAIARARQQADRKRAEAQSQSRLQEEARARFEAEQRAKAAESQISDVLRIRQLAQSPNPQDRFEAARQLGVPLDQLADYLVQVNTPEGRIAAVEAKFEARLAEERARREAVEQQWQNERAVAEMSRREQEFVTRATSTHTVKGEDSPLYPELVDMPPAFVVTLGKDLAERTRQAWQRQGKTRQEAERIVAQVSDHELLSFLNQTRADHRTKNGTKTPPASQLSPKQNPAPAGATAQASQPTPRTVTNSDKSESLSLPQNWDDLSESDQRKWLAKKYKAAVQASESKR